MERLSAVRPVVDNATIRGYGNMRGMVDRARSIEREQRSSGVFIRPRVVSFG